MKRPRIFIFILFAVYGLLENLDAYDGAGFTDYNSLSVPEVSYPTPTSMELNKFLGYPVSPATGLADISIPLCEVKAGPLTLPFELKYHSSGIKIQDNAGIAGLGWSLFPGLKITRTINGKPDDLYPVVKELIESDCLRPLDGRTISFMDGCWNDAKRLAEYAVPATWRFPETLIYPSNYIDKYFNETIRPELQKMQKIDSDYDLFTVHLPTTSATFIISKETYESDYKVITIPKKPLQFKLLKGAPNQDNFELGQIYGFEVTDEQGIKYIFGEERQGFYATEGPEYIEISSIAATCFDHPELYIGWMLRKIILPGGEEIALRYENRRYRNYYASRTYTVIDKGYETGNGLPGYTFPSPYLHAHNIMFTGTEGYQTFSTDNSTEPSYEIPDKLKEKVLRVIQTPWANIFFDYTDKAANKQLKSIKVYSPEEDKILKNIHFEFADDEFLTGLSVSGNGRYTFEYDRRDSLLRKKAQGDWIFKRAVDWWGYFNGATSNVGSVPGCNLEIYSNSPTRREQIPNYSNGETNRLPHMSHMQARSLQKINYPTGGYFKLHYGVHRLEDQRIVSGLRVDSTELYDPVSKRTVTKRYEYEDGHHSAGIYPTQDAFITTRYYGDYYRALNDRTDNFYQIAWEAYVSCRVRTIHTLSPYDFMNGYSTPFWYGRVSEYVNDGKTVYKYDHNPDRLDGTSISHGDLFGYHEYEIWRFIQPAPLLLSKEIYKKEANRYIRIQKHKYEYFSDKNTVYYSGATCFPYKTLYPGRSNPNAFNSRNSAFLMPVEYTFGYNLDVPTGISPQVFFHSNHTNRENVTTPFIFAPYRLLSGVVYVKSEQSITYGTNGNDSVVQEISYEYDLKRPYNLIKKETTDSRNEQWTERYYYSNHVVPHKNTLNAAQQTVIAQMEADNYKTSLIEQTLEKPGKLLFGKLYGYKKIGNLHYKPETLYCYEQGSFSPRIQYLRYDRHGNPLYINKDGEAERVVYLWGYAGQYPVAEIRNATYGEVEAALGNSYIESLSNSITFSTADFNKLNALRTQLPYAQVTTWTYIPQVGIETVINPQGVVTRYKYDAHGRLVETSIMEGGQKCVLNDYEYHYISE